MVVSESHNQAVTITLSPHQSATWPETKLFISVIGGFVLMIGMFWAWMGAYLVLPFAGLEVGLLAYFMRKVSFATYKREVITIKPDRVVVRAGMHAIEKCLTMERSAAHVIVTKGKGRKRQTDPMKLRLSDSQSSIDIGEFLNCHEKILVHDALKQAGLTMQNAEWWVSTS